MKVLLLVLLLGAVEAGGYNSVLSFPGPANTNDYVALNVDLPSLSAYTVCTWILKDYGGSSKYFFSYATEYDDNEILLGDKGYKWILWNKKESSADKKSVRDEWYHACFTWSTNGQGTVFVDGVPGKTTSNMGEGKVKIGKGILVLGQEQDALGGKFDKNQAFIGQLYNLNMWNRVLSKEEIVNMHKGNFCGRLTSAVKSGIVISWDDIVAQEMVGAASLQDARCVEPSNSLGGGRVMRFPAEISTSNYLEFHPRFGVLHAFTACTWLYKFYSTDKRYFFSYADKTHHNAILLGETGKGLGFWLGTEDMETSGILEPAKWYQSCFVWDTTEGAAIYVNGEVAAVKKGMAVGDTLSEGGVANIGQEQDIVGGNYDKNQAFAGKLYNFNMFSRALSADEIAAMYLDGFCASVDDNLTDDVVVSWNNIVNMPVEGDVVFDAGDDAASCNEVEAWECTWEAVADTKNVAAGNGYFEGHEDAQTACLAFDDCSGISCNEDDQCWLKVCPEDLQRADGHTVYRVSCS